MKCPRCGEGLDMAERQGVEIDYCPDCRGVWLDRGELDKIIERTSSSPFAGDREQSESFVGRGCFGAPKKRKRKSFLEDMFDF